MVLCETSPGIKGQVREGALGGGLIILLKETFSKSKPIDSCIFCFRDKKEAAVN